MIKYVLISEYKERYKPDENYDFNEYDIRKEYYKKVNSNVLTATPEEYEKLIISSFKNKEYSLLEVIPEDKVNIFFDIDNIQNLPNNYQTINKIVIDLMNFFGFTRYPIITSNIIYSKKLSYHIIFPYYTSLQYLNYMVIIFLYHYKQYEYYLDPTIYTPYFLFRSIGSYKPATFNKKRKNKNVHDIIFTKYSYQLYNIKKSLIQYTEKSEYYKPGLIINNYRKLIKNQYYFKCCNYFISYKFISFILFLFNLFLIISLLV